jgi:hypothetical protein
MRRIQYPLGSRILRVGQILHVKSRRRGALVRLTATPGRDAHSRHTGISGDRLLHERVSGSAAWILAVAAGVPGFS